MDWDPAQERVRATQFKYGTSNPLSWRRKAELLKWAVDKLFDAYHHGEHRFLSHLVKETEDTRNGQVNTISRNLVGDELVDYLDSSLSPVYLLLMGFAIQNLLKGILVAQHPEYQQARTRLGQELKKHDFLDLFASCQLIASSEEIGLLTGLQEYVLWRGRYPSPIKLEDMPPQKKNDGTWDHGGIRFQGRELQQHVDRLYARLGNELEQERAKQDLKAGESTA